MQQFILGMYLLIGYDIGPRSMEIAYIKPNFLSRGIWKKKKWSPKS
jgi:hypothetical protein